MNSESNTQLRLDDHRRIEAICTAFESNWKPVDHDFASLIRETEGVMRATLLCELVRLDIELLREQGKNPTPEDYASEVTLGDVSLVTDDFWSHVSEDSVAQSKPPKLILGRYEIGETLGAGGIGTVYRAFDRQHQRTVAIKLLKPVHRADAEAVTRFEIEGQLTGALQHPGIPPIYDRGQLDDGTPFFVMKVVEGKTLAQLFSSSETVTKEQGYFFHLFDKVAQTVAYAHGQGVIHRDLKPQNIMVGGFGEVQVMDWGLAKKVGVAESPTPSRMEELVGEEGLTSAGDFIGTPRHMSPEQSRGELTKQTPRIDVFGLGTILFQILTGETLYPGDSAREAVTKTQRGELDDAYEKLGRLSFSPLNQLCRRCLAVDPNDRPASASDVADETQDFLAELQRDLNRAEAEKTQAEIVSHEQRKRVRWITAISLTSLVGISSLTFVAFRQSQEAGRAAVAEREARLDAEQQFQSTRQINDFLTNVLSATRPEELGREVTHRQVIDKAIPQLEGRFRNQPAVEGSLRMTLGETYRWLDAVDLAEDQLRQAIDAFQRADSLDERSILRAKNELAEVLLVHDRSDDQPEAIQLRREVVGRSQELFGKADPLTIDAMIGLGKVLTFNSEHEEAEEWLTKAQRIIRETEELEGFDSRPLLLNLARVHKHLDRTEEAEAMYKSLLNDPESSSVIRMSAMMQLGEMYHWDEQLVLAEKTLNQALELYQRELGKDHRLTLSTMRKYIRVLDEAKQYQRLLQIADENILLHENWDGIARSSVMEARKMKALALAGVGKLDEAEAFFRESISLVRMHRGDDSRQAERARKDLDRFLKKYRD